jgi:long-subunit fatty acid transport protein
MAQAGGLDRSGTPVDIIFENGNYFELSFGMVMPELTGSDVLANSIANVGNDFNVGGAGLKLDLSDKVSIAVIYDQPYGSDIVYGGNPAATMLGGTSAVADSDAMTALVRYKINDRFSVYGGARSVKAGGDITLSGLAYGPLAPGYSVNFATDHGAGYVLGAAFEIPEKAMRVALTYHSSIDMSFATTETFPMGAPIFTGFTQSELPQSLELAVQSGISAKHRILAFGSVRWSDWEAFTLQPNGLGANLADLDSAISYELGVGKQFTDKFAASLTVNYEAGGSDDLVSPLAPSNGQIGVAIGGKYRVNENVSISGGIRYTWLGDAQPETGTPDVARGTFVDNTALSAGLKLAFHF